MTGANYGCGNSPGATPWTFASQYLDNNVYDRDSIDPDVIAGGIDSTFFDVPGTAITYFAGHGICSGCEGGAACTSTSQCTNPQAGYFQKSPGTCRNGPPGSLGPPNNGPTCCYLTDRALFTSSTSDTFGHRNVYSRVWTPGTRYAAWGESSFSGPWSGAGAYGGTNMVVLDISCGTLPPFWVQQLQPSFAGIHYLATIMPVTGDTASSPDRGAYFAHRWLVNASEPMANAWAYLVGDLPLGEGTPCSGNNYALGGGNGINGCGCYLITSFDEYWRAYYKMAYGHWGDLRDDNNDAIASTSYFMFAACNYDSDTYPWQL